MEFVPVDAGPVSGLVAAGVVVRGRRLVASRGVGDERGGPGVGGSHVAHPFAGAPHVLLGKPVMHERRAFDCV